MIGSAVPMGRHINNWFCTASTHSPDATVQVVQSLLQIVVAEPPEMETTILGALVSAAAEWTPPAMATKRPTAAVQDKNRARRQW